MSLFVDGKKVLVGIYYTEVEDWYFEWFNGGLRWKGLASQLNFACNNMSFNSEYTKVQPLSLEFKNRLSI